MTTAKTDITLSTPAKSARRAHGGPQAETLKLIATHWNALSGTQKATWKNLSGQTVQTGVSALPNPVGAYPTFVQVASVMLGAGGAIPTVAPAQPVAPVPLPAVTLAATYDALAGLTLTVAAAAPYPYPVTLYAAPPAISGLDTPALSRFKRIGYLPALTVAPISIALQYQTRFHVPSEGYEIIVSLVGVSASGHQTHGLLATAIAGGIPLQAARPADLELSKAA